MPVIQPYVRKMSITGEGPNALQDVGSAGMVGNAIAQFGKTAMNVTDNLADMIIRRDAQLKAQDNVDAAEKAGVEINATLRAAEENYKTEGNKFDTLGDLRTYSAGYNKKLYDGLKGKYLDGVTDPQRRQMIEKHLDSKMETFLNSSSSHQASMNKKFTDSGMDRVTGDAVQGALRGEDLNATLQGFQNSIANYHAAGSISEPEAVGKLVKGSEQIAIAYLDGMEVREPAKFVELVESGKYNSMLPEAQFRHFQERAVHVKKTEELKAKSVAGDQAYNEVFTQFNLGSSDGDYAGAIRHVNDPNNLPGLDRGTRETLFNQIKGQEAYILTKENQRAKELHNKDLDAIGELRLSGNISAAVKLTAASPYIGGMDKAKIIHNLQTPPPEGRSNSATYLAGVEKMYDSSVPLEEKKTWLLQNRSQLNASDFKHMSNIGMSQERSNDKAAVKSGIETIKAVLVSPGFSSQTQKERLDKAVKLYESGIEQNKDTLKTPDQIKTYANQILSMPQFSNINPMEDVKADMKRLRGVGLGEAPAQQAPAAQVKTVTIDGKQYRDGDVITKNDKQFRVRAR